MSLTYAFAIIIAYFLYSHLFMLQQAVGAGFRESLLLSQSSSAVFSDVTVIVSPARFGQERSSGEKLCSLLWRAVQPLLNAQWQLGSIQLSHSFSTELSVGVANVESSQSDAWGASEHIQPIWIRHWGKQFPNVKSARPRCYLLLHISDNQKTFNNFKHPQRSDKPLQQAEEN